MCRQRSVCLSFEPALPPDDLLDLERVCSLSFRVCVVLCGVAKCLHGHQERGSGAMFAYALTCLSFCLCLHVSAECLHGHQERGAGAVPTIFPQPLLLASSFDDALAWQVWSSS